MWTGFLRNATVALISKHPEVRPGDLESVGPLGAEEFEQLRRLAHTAFGLDLKPGKEELVTARLRRLVCSGGFGSYRDYCRHVLRDSTGEALAAMIDALATNHTSFLREPDHFEFLQHEVIPALAQRDSIELWSAACSTGEEVWTLACLFQDALPSRRTRICASDISRKALHFASQASYSAERCQGLPAAWLSRYFTPEPGPVKSYRVAPQIRSLASFRRLNLLEDYGWPRPFPLIFCRNVMIYFDKSTQEQVVRQLAGCLEPGGYLLVGHAESLTRVAHSLEYVRPAVYRKPVRRSDKWIKS
jgi:chemotaxis protein methyltransferase CheR